MDTLIIIVFFLGYLAITLEHNLKIDKLIPALAMMAILWAMISLTHMPVFDIDTITRSLHETHIEEILLHHLGKTAEILVFLIGAMTIVEIIDYFDGFATIKGFIRTNVKVKLLWIFSILAFILSAIIDNLTATIVLITILQKVVQDRNTRLWFAGLIIVAANAGGAWSPIGDVTTTMLWIGGQLTTATIISTLFIPSLVAMVVPLGVLTFTMKGNVTRPITKEGLEHYINPTTAFERNLIFFLGLAGLLFVPIFKTVTHLPPFMGMMLSLGVMWAVTEVIHSSKNREDKSHLSVIGVLRKVDTASVLFFLGILLAVAGLQSAGHLAVMAGSLNDFFNGNIYAINIVIGLLSSIVDNVPLVAGSMGMYEVAEAGVFAQDGVFWQFLAFCAGTGGSALIIGSAAGVAVMGLEKIDFVWYLKKISILALIGYFAGAGTYILIQSF